MNDATEPKPVEPKPYGTRAEHLAWVKLRALEYVDAGDLQNAFASFASDMKKHEATADHPALLLGFQLLMMGYLNTPQAMRGFIEGSN